MIFFFCGSLTGIGIEQTPHLCSMNRLCHKELKFAATATHSPLFEKPQPVLNAGLITDT